MPLFTIVGIRLTVLTNERITTQISTLFGRL